MLSFKSSHDGKVIEFKTIYEVFEFIKERGFMYAKNRYESVDVYNKTGL